MCKLIGNDTCRHISRDIWLIIIVWNGIFLLGIHHVARIRRIRCHIGPPPWISPPPQQKSHMLSQYYIMEFVLEEICHRGGRFAIWYYSLMGKFCHRISSGGGRFATWYYSPLGKFCYGISSGGRFAIWYGIISPWGSSVIGFLPRGGGGEVCHMVLSPPPGEVLLWDFFRGKVCHKVFLHGERLPYGIIFEGTICHGICSLIKKCVCVWGGGRVIYHRGGSFTIIMVLFLPCGSSSM